MSTDNPMSFYRENVDAWGPLEWFDRLAKAVHARSQAVRDKDDIAFEAYKNIASSSATRLVSDFEDKVRMALTTLRELEKANVAYVYANTELLATLEGAAEITRLRQLLSEAEKREREARAKALEEAALWHDAKVQEYTDQIAVNDAYLARGGRLSHESRANEYCDDMRSCHRRSSEHLRFMAGRAALERSEG